MLRLWQAPHLDCHAKQRTNFVTTIVRPMGGIRPSAPLVSAASLLLYLGLPWALHPSVYVKFRPNTTPYPSWPVGHPSAPLPWASYP